MKRNRTGARGSGCLGLLMLIGAIWLCSRGGTDRVALPTPTVAPTATSLGVRATSSSALTSATSEPSALLTPSDSSRSVVRVSKAQREPRGTITASTLNVRLGPGTNYSVAAQLRRGQTVTLLSESGDWLQIRTEAGVTGWVSAQHVSFAESTTEVALATATPQASDNAVAQEGRVVSITDGDTIRVLLDGQEFAVRYIGVDAPEPSEPYGAEARDQNARLVSGKIVRLESDVSLTDSFGRLLRYVWVGNLMVNAEMVRLGYARAIAYPPDLKHQDELNALQNEAEKAARGLWAGVTAARGANLRGGPGTNYPIVGQVKAGDRLSIIARNAAGDWYRLVDGAWIAAFLVVNAPGGLPLATNIPTPAPTKPPAVRAPAPVPASNCDPCYPGVCIPQVSYDLDCSDISACRFRVICDPHGFDGDNDGIGCETCR